MDAQRQEPAPRESKPNGMPFSWVWPLSAGVVVGLVLRFIFSGKPGGPYAAMMASFIYLAPLVVGAVTVYAAERQKRRTWSYYFWVPFYANCLFVLGTLLIEIEGLICAIVIIPLFALLGAVGGLLMGLICRSTNWPKQALYSLALLPLALGGLEQDMPVPERIGVVERTMVIKSPPGRVWKEINNAKDIQPDEVRRAWLFRIGVPVPRSGITEVTPRGIVRNVSMGKSIHYEQVVTEQRENEYVHWTYRYSKDSFPPYALDEHVVLGGYYFDVKDTAYILVPTAEGTELRISMTYRVTTQFNWYATPVAKVLLGNFEDVILEFYRHRSEHEG